jgi:membrane associated rhomboid family serine protease
MKSLCQKCLAALSPGVRPLLLLWVAVSLAAALGQLFRTVDLYRWLALDVSAAHHGQVWRLVTYAWLPAGIMDFAMTALALILLGPLLERHWTRRELWLYCGIATVGAGVADVLFASGAPPLVGAASVMLAWLLAWAFVSGHEPVPVPVFGSLTVRTLVLILAGLSLFMTLLSGGLVSALVLASGAAVGWLYLWLRHKWLMTRASRVVSSGRIQRLEL